MRTGILKNLDYARPSSAILFPALLLLAGVGSAVAVVHYVDVNSTNATPPFANWTTAATNIQDAVDVAAASDEIVVTNGTYANGGRSFDGVTTNRVDVDKPLALRSVNGPRVTTIYADSSFRCVHLTNGASIAGFTLTSDGFGVQGIGGGVLCENTAVVSNCVISGCSVVARFGEGGGAFGGTLNNCTLIGNSAGYDQNLAEVGYEGYGGGAYGSTLNNCTLIANSVDAITRSAGGGAAYCTLNNCTLTGNSAPQNFAGEAYGGGAYLSRLNNCILYFNTIFFSTNNTDNYDSWCSLNYCCTTPQPANGFGNITNAPLFVDTNGWADLPLQSNSPCINAGNNAYVVGSTDLEGNPRIAGGTVDLGAYEFQSPTSIISYAWLQQYGLPTDGSADFADPDGDCMNNWQEWRCGTNPTNARSVLRMLTPVVAGTNVVVAWQSANGKNYFLERSASLAPASFTLLATNIAGQPGTTSFACTNALGAGPWFYRVGVGN